jgi:hypothetical protein
MSKVFVNIGLSLDGYLAPEGMRMDDAEYKGWGAKWGAKWGAMMGWLLNQQSFRESHQMSTGSETEPVKDLVRQTMEPIGANIMEKRMFD